MNADKRKCLIAFLVGSLVMVCCLNVQAEDMQFELQDMPAQEMRDVKENPEPILQWGFPMSRENFKLWPEGMLKGFQYHIEHAEESISPIDHMDEEFLSIAHL